MRVRVLTLSHIFRKVVWARQPNKTNRRIEYCTREGEGAIVMPYNNDLKRRVVLVLVRSAYGVLEGLNSYRSSRHALHRLENRRHA